jgi:hypothetical protein
MTRVYMSNGCKSGHKEAVVGNITRLGNFERDGTRTGLNCTPGAEVPFHLATGQIVPLS